MWFWMIHRIKVCWWDWDWSLWHSRIQPWHVTCTTHYHDVIMGAIASQITSLASVDSAVKLGIYQRKHQSSASLAFVRGIHRRPVNSPQKGPVPREMLPFDDVIMVTKGADIRSSMLLTKWTSLTTRYRHSMQIYVRCKYRYVNYGNYDRVMVRHIWGVKRTFIPWFTDIGKSFTDIGKWITDIGKWITDIGKWFTDIGKWFTDIGKSSYLPISYLPIHPIVICFGLIDTVSQFVRIYHPAITVRYVVDSQWPICIWYTISG